MHPKSPMWLETITDATSFILEETASRSRTDYEEDRLLRLAAERSVGVIGRALSRIEQTDPAIVQQITDHRTVVDISDHLLHEYDNVEALRHEAEK